MTVKRKAVARDKAGAHTVSNFGFGGAQENVESQDDGDGQDSD